MSDHAGLQQRATEFRIGVSRGVDGPLIAVAGDVDLHSAPELREQLAVLVDEGSERIVVDLSRATFLDSMALGVLVGAKKRLAAKHATIELVVTRPEIRRILEIAMLDEIFVLHESREAAADGAAG